MLWEPWLYFEGPLENQGSFGAISHNYPTLVDTQSIKSPHTSSSDEGGWAKLYGYIYKVTQFALPYQHKIIPKVENFQFQEYWFISGIGDKNPNKKFELYLDQGNNNEYLLPPKYGLHETSSTNAPCRIDGRWKSKWFIITQWCLL
jgi:hypothetical protein